MSHRPARINPDTLPVLIVAALLAAGLAAASFALTFAALLDVAVWANVTPRLAWAVPVMLDAAIVVYTLAVRWQDDPRLFRVSDLSKLHRRGPAPAVDPREQARQLRAQGLTVREVAAALGRAPSTVGAWIKESS